MADQTIRRLNRLLEQEREALLSGALDRIPEMTSEKETLLRQIPASGASPHTLSIISDRIARNQALLLSAQKGVKAAETTIANLDQATQQSAVYDKSGAVSHMRSGGPAMSQKI